MTVPAIPPERVHAERINAIGNALDKAIEALKFEKQVLDVAS
jgi:hypothetical protein